MTKVSVIIPVYNVEAFIERCANSLMQQTLRDVEFIFVDDASPDSSISILHNVLEKYPERLKNVQILTHKQNRGLPAARNSGMAVASGEYIFHCDSDDFVEPNMLEVLYNAAQESDADIVWCDWFLTYQNNERYMKQPCFASSEEAVRAMLGGAMKFNVWNKLVRRSLYTDNKIVFPSGYGMGEDMTMIRLAVHAKKISYVPRAFYHYVKTNTQAFSQTYSEQHLKELRHNVDETAAFILAHYGESWKQDVAFFKLEAKFPFLISDGRKGEYQRWAIWYPEANAYIRENHNISRRSRMLQLLAAKGHFRAVWLYNKIVMQWLYSLFYNK